MGVATVRASLYCLRTCRSPWCVIDVLTLCRVRPICDRHDRRIRVG